MAPCGWCPCFRPRRRSSTPSGSATSWSGSPSSATSHPRARLEKTVVVGGRDTRGMTPAEIDEYVKGQLAAGGDLYTLHAGALAGLDPELILTQDLCRVCALPSGQVSGALDHLGCRADVLSLDPYTLDEVLGTILAIGERTGVPERAERLVAGLRSRLDAVAAAVAGRPRPRVAVVEWVDPPFTAGHWVPDLVAAAGGEPVAARPGAKSVQTTWAEFAAAAPDLVLVTPCGFHLDAGRGAGPCRRAAPARGAGVGAGRGCPRGPPGAAARRRRRGDRRHPAPRGVPAARHHRRGPGELTVPGAARTRPPCGRAGVPGAGVEPARLSAAAFKAAVSAVPPPGREAATCVAAATVSGQVVRTQPTWPPGGATGRPPPSPTGVPTGRGRSASPR